MEGGLCDFEMGTIPIDGKSEEDAVPKETCASLREEGKCPRDIVGENLPGIAGFWLE